jgi:hypothetical protein
LGYTTVSYLGLQYTILVFLFRLDGSLSNSLLEGSEGWQEHSLALTRYHRYMLDALIYTTLLLVVLSPRLVGRWVPLRRLGFGARMCNAFDLTNSFRMRPETRASDRRWSPPVRLGGVSQVEANTFVSLPPLNPTSSSLPGF